MLEAYRLYISGETPEPVIQPSGALVMGIGNSTARAKTSQDNKNFLSFYFENDGTSDSNRGEYLRLYLSGANGGGEALRAFTTVLDVTGSTAHGAHISLSFGSTGKISGLGVANRNTLHIPNDGTQTGTLAASQIEIWSDGSDSDPAGATEVSFIRINNDGHADGKADIDTDAFFFSAQGFTEGAGSLLRVAAPTTLAASLKVKVGATTYYLPLYSAQS